MKTRNFIILFEQEEDGGFSVSVPSLPGCFSQGDTFEVAMKNIRAAVRLYLKDADKSIYKSETQEFAVPMAIGVA